MIRIIIEECADGGLKCYTDPVPGATGAEALKVVGMLELAKCSLLAGRWGVLDGNGMSHCYKDQFEIYREALMRSTMHAVGRSALSEDVPHV